MTVHYIHFYLKLLAVQALLIEVIHVCEGSHSCSLQPHAINFDSLSLPHVSGSHIKSQPPTGKNE